MKLKRAAQKLHLPGQNCKIIKLTHTHTMGIILIMIYTHNGVLDDSMEFMHYTEILLARCIGEDWRTYEEIWVP